MRLRIFRSSNRICCAILVSCCAICVCVLLLYVTIGHFLKVIKKIQTTQHSTAQHNKQRCEWEEEEEENSSNIIAVTLLQQHNAKIYFYYFLFCQRDCCAIFFCESANCIYCICVRVCFVNVAATILHFVAHFIIGVHIQYSTTTTTTTTTTLIVFKYTVCLL